MPQNIVEHASSPFSPGYGRRPLVFGGHEDELDELTEVYRTLDFGENQSVLISGLRGAGKTSMLTMLQDAALEQGWAVISDDASGGLMERIMETTIPALLDTLEPTSRTQLSGLGIWQFNAQLQYVDRHRQAKPLLRRDLIALSEHLRGTGILITIDEVSSGKTRLRELSRVALEVSHALRAGANVMIVFAGIKLDLDALLEHDHTTFLRRSRQLDFRRLTPAQTRHVLEESIRIGGRRIDEDALKQLIAVSQGYPYLVQLVGDYAWRNTPRAEVISRADAEVAHHKAIIAVQQRVISRVYQDLSEKDREFMQAMAVDTDRSKVSDLVTRMEVSAQYVQVYKRRLIDTGYVTSDGHGYVAFSLPYLGEYVRSKDSEPTSAETNDDWDAFPPPPST